MQAKRIAALAFTNCQVLDVVGPLQVFASANSLLGFSAYEVGIVAETTQPIVSNASIQLVPHWQCAEFSQGGLVLDTLLVSGGTGVELQQQNTSLINWLTDQSSRVERLAAVCTGAFLLAKAGVFNGERVATHWRYCELLAKSFPGLQVDSDSIYIRSGKLYSSAGVTSGIDLALALLEEDYGAEVSMSVARELVVFRQRPGGQQQYSIALQRQMELPKPVQRVVDKLQANMEQNVSLQLIADEVHISARHLSRLFKQTLGKTPAQYLQTCRMERARNLLEQSSLSCEQIAIRCGLKSADNLRRLFIRQLGVTPLDYRQRFTVSGC